jgi:hypothetical protein
MACAAIAHRKPHFAPLCSVAAAKPARVWLLINLGWADPAGNYPRNPRLAFEVAARIE